MPTQTQYLAIFFVLLTMLSGCSKPDYQTADGRSGRFADTRGKWLLINYWADWCKPCIEEMPELHQFQQQQSDRVVLLTVNYDGLQGQSLQQQIEKLQIKLPVLLADPAPLLGFQRPDALPTTLVFDPQGVLHATLQGAQSIKSLTEATTK